MKAEEGKRLKVKKTIGYGTYSDEELKQYLEGQARISLRVGEAKVAKAILDIISNPKQVNYRLKEITEYCENIMEVNNGR